MGKFIEIPNYGTAKYVALTDKPFEKLFAMQNILKFTKFQYSGVVHASQIFYDTPNDILYKAGILLSRIQEDDRVFFKVEQTLSLKASFKISSKKVFSHKVGAKDSLKDHSFYLVDGIRGLFSTPIGIDLENVIKNCIPKISIFINANIYKVICGSGFRALLSLEETKYENYETKRTAMGKGLTVKHTGPEQYLKEFDLFNSNIVKYCKDLVAVNEDEYEHAKIMTKKIDPKQAKIDKKKAKEQIANYKASGEDNDE